MELYIFFSVSALVLCAYLIGHMSGYEKCQKFYEDYLDNRPKRQYNSDMIITPSKFALLVEELVKDKKMSYMDAILMYCKDNGIDPSGVSSLINKHLKEKIAFEAQELNMLKEKKSKLPI